MALAEDFGRQSRPLWFVEGEGQDVCGDCGGALVVVDDDGSISGTVGALVDCICVALAVPPGFAECRACAALVPVPDPRLGEYLAFCAASGREPAWCPRCGDYRPLANGNRAACGCVAVPERPGQQFLGAMTVVGPWGIER